MKREIIMLSASKANFAYQQALQNRSQIIDKADNTSFSPANGPINNGKTAVVGGTFADLLKNNASDTLEDLKKAEGISIQASKGNADLNEVVNAVNTAESSLRTMITLRDKVIQAYQEILKMPV